MLCEIEFRGVAADLCLELAEFGLQIGEVTELSAESGGGQGEPEREGSESREVRVHTLQPACACARSGMTPWYDIAAPRTLTSTTLFAQCHPPDSQTHVRER